MSPLTRRQLLALGAAGAGAAAVGGAGLWWTGGGGETLGGGRELVQPEVLTGRDGVLDLALEAAPARVRIGAREAQVQAFNGSLPGPTLRVRGGDTVRVVLQGSLLVGIADLLLACFGVDVEGGVVVYWRCWKDC